MRDIKENITKEFIPNIHYELLDDIRDKFFEFTKNTFVTEFPISPKMYISIFIYII